MTAATATPEGRRRSDAKSWQPFAVAGFVLMAAGADARAQTPSDEAPPRPTISRFDEDWAQYCENGTASPPLKCLPVAGALFSLGMDARIRYEIYDPSAFGRGAQDDDGYWLVRAAGHAALELSPRWRAFGQVFTANAIDRTGGPRPADRNELDLVQGFVEWRPSGRDDTFVRFGRQEIAFGAGRLLAASEGSNVRRQFDGLRASVSRGDIAYQAIATGLVQVRPGAFDDSASLDRAVLGLGALQSMASGSTNALYFIAARRPERIFGAPPAIQDRNTLGARVVRQTNRWAGELEVIGQNGEAGGLDIAAWAAAGEAAWLSRIGKVQMRYALRFNIASGDRDPADGALNGFDPLFPNPAYTGSIPLISPTNTIAINPRVSASWASNMRVSADVAVIRRYQDGDQIYTFSGTAIAGQPTSRDDVGRLWSVNMSRPLTAHWSATTTLSYFDAGDYFANARNADTRFLTVNFIYQY